MKRYFLLFLPLLFVLQCSQAEIIYVRNISKSQLISVEQILKESGLKEPKPVKTQETKKTESKQTKVNKVKSQESTLKNNTQTMTIPSGEEFSINIDPKNLFIVLKSVEGDISVLNDRSNPEKGFFLFRMGKANSIVSFQLYDLGGKLLAKNIYQIQVAPALDNSNNKSTNQLTVIDTTKINNMNSDTSNSSIIQTILMNLSSKSSREKIKLLEKTLNENTFSAADRQKLNIELTKNYISEYQYSKANEIIKSISDPDWKSYLTGKVYHLQKKPTQAMQYYLQSLRKNPAFKADLVKDMIELFTSMGNIDLTTIEEIQTANLDIQDIDPETFALNQIGIARLYEMNGEIDKALQTLKNILAGNYSYKTEQKAQEYLDELNQNFLDYR